jgi:hypothetical protein
LRKKGRTPSKLPRWLSEKHGHLRDGGQQASSVSTDERAEVLALPVEQADVVQWQNISFPS